MAHPCAKSQKYFQGESRREIKYMNYRSFNTIILKGKRESPLDFSETVFYYYIIIILLYILLHIIIITSVLLSTFRMKIFLCLLHLDAHFLLFVHGTYAFVARLSEMCEHRSLEKNNNQCLYKKLKDEHY